MPKGTDHPLKTLLPTESLKFAQNELGLGSSMHTDPSVSTLRSFRCGLGVDGRLKTAVDLAA
jgi:hypothetical protein